MSDPDKSEMAEIGVDLDDKTFIILAKEAHRRDITFNALMIELVMDNVEHYCPTESLAESIEI